MTDLAELLADRPYMLLDFDGPVCGVFAGISSRRVAQRLGQAIGLPLPEHLGATSDPFELLQYAAQFSSETAHSAEHELTRLEVEAVGFAAPTPYAHDVIRAASRRKGGAVAIVSNNSVAAIDTYLSEHGLRDDIAGIYARTSAGTPLKPNPHLLSSAMASLGVEPERSTFTGDSTTDLEAANSAHVPAIGYANKPGKADRFAAYSPAVTISSMSALLQAVRFRSISL